MKVISYVIRLDNFYLHFDSQHTSIKWVKDPHQATKFKSSTIHEKFKKLNNMGLIVFPIEDYQFIPYAKACHPNEIIYPNC